MKKKKAICTIAGPMMLGVMSIAAPMSSFAAESAGTLIENETPGVYDVKANPSFSINHTVKNSMLLLKWDKYKDADEYLVSKLIKVDSEYVVQKEIKVKSNHFTEKVSSTVDCRYRIVPLVKGEYVLNQVGELDINEAAEESKNDQVSETIPNKESNNNEPGESNQQPNTSPKEDDPKSPSTPVNDTEVTSEDTAKQTLQEDQTHKNNELVARNNSHAFNENTKGEVTKEATTKGNSDKYKDKSQNESNSPKQDVKNPDVPKTGDGSAQKIASPIVLTLVALLAAFILVPNRSRKRQSL